MHVTDTQLIEIPAGGLGRVGSNLIPPDALIISQGALSTTTFGAGVTQPLTQLLKVRAANDMASAEVRATPDWLARWRLHRAQRPSDVLQDSDS